MEDIIIPLAGISIPIIAMFVALAIARAALRQRTQRAEMEHQERMLAIEKGAPLPPLTTPPEKGKNPYLWGFILIAIGLAMMVGMWVEGDRDWGWSMLFLLPGVAILAANLLYLKRSKADQPPRNALPQESSLS
ncbi:MAG: hypothetical protein C4524_13560 [Candidatus Zixiibacteriota bacterium]|nr:MAG: hypothetical protein C4524_13560 [candidate division Zixibacteria bacterium]